MSEESRKKAAAGSMGAPAPVSEAASSAFAEALPRLLSLVNDKFDIEARIAESHSPRDLSLISDAHSHFGEMLKAVYEFDLAGHALDEFAWYVSTLATRGFQESYFRRMLEAWMIAIHAAIKPPESGELTRLLEHLCRHLHAICSAPETEREPLSPEAQHFLSLLLDKRRKPAAEYALQIAAGEGKSGNAYSSVVLPALSQIGWLWQRNEISVADEHAATEIARYVLFRLLDSLPAKRPLGKSVLVACVPGEEHDVGVQIAGAYLEAAGWDTIQVGRSAPADEILRMLEARQPHVAVFSINMLARLPAARDLFAKVRERFTGIRIIAGGRAAVAARKVLADNVDAIVDGLEDLQETALRMAGENA